MAPNEKNFRQGAGRANVARPDSPERTAKARPGRTAAPQPGRTAKPRPEPSAPARPEHTAKARPAPAKPGIRSNDGTLAIMAHDKRRAVRCTGVECVMVGGHGGAAFCLKGIEKAMLGQRAVVLGYYATQADARQEMDAIDRAFARGDAAYRLRFALPNL